MSPSSEPDAWRQLLEEAQDAVREAAHASGGRDPEGLLLLAEWLAGGVSDLDETNSRAMADAFGMDSEEVELEGVNLVLEEATYDRLFGILRSGGWLESPNW